MYDCYLVDAASCVLISRALPVIENQISFRHTTW